METGPTEPELQSSEADIVAAGQTIRVQHSQSTVEKYINAGVDFTPESPPDLEKEDIPNAKIYKSTDGGEAEILTISQDTSEAVEMDISLLSRLTSLLVDSFEGVSIPSTSIPLEESTLKRKEMESQFEEREPQKRPLPQPQRRPRYLSLIHI